MTYSISVVRILWPAFFVIGGFILYLFTLTGQRYTRTGAIAGGLIAISLLFAIYGYPPIRTAIRWGLTILGLSLPPSTGIIAIRYVVDET